MDQRRGSRDFNGVKKVTSMLCESQRATVHKEEKGMEGRKGARLIKISAVFKGKQGVDEFDKIKQETKQLVPALSGHDSQMVRAGKRVKHSSSQMVERRPHTPHTTGHITLRGTAPDTRQPHTDTHERAMLCLGMTEGGAGRRRSTRQAGGRLGMVERRR